VLQLIYRYIPERIFLTGLPRSGTTWAGAALSAATRSPLIEEPFNWEWHPDRRDYHMKYLPAGSEELDTIRILRREIIAWGRPRRTLRVLLHRRVIIRDVLSCLAVEHFWHHLQTRVIIMVRHPCGVASSWIRLGFNVSSRMGILLGQERLLEEHLRPFQAHLKRRQDFYFQLGAYWGATYYVLQRLSLLHPEWRWITHEALCLQPEVGFERLLNHLGYQMGSQGQRFLQAYNREPRAGEGQFSVARVSAQEPGKWKIQLTQNQVSSVLAGAEPFGVLERFYPGEK